MIARPQVKMTFAPGAEFGGVRRIVVETLRTDVAPKVKRWAEDDIRRRRQSSGEEMPRKAAATIRNYKYKGYNTKDFLYRTGGSTRVRFKNIRDGVRVYALDPWDALKYHVKNHRKAEDSARVYWLDYRERERLWVGKLLHMRLRRYFRRTKAGNRPRMPY